MEKKKVFSMLANRVVFAGTQSECEEYIAVNNAMNPDDSLYIVKA